MGSELKMGSIHVVYSLKERLLDDDYDPGWRDTFTPNYDHLRLRLVSVLALLVPLRNLERMLDRRTSLKYTVHLLERKLLGLDGEKIDYEDEHGIPNGEDDVG